MRTGEDLPGYMRVPDLVTGGSNPVGCDPALAPASPRMGAPCQTFGVTLGII